MVDTVYVDMMLKPMNNAFQHKSRVVHNTKTYPQKYPSPLARYRLAHLPSGAYQISLTRDCV